MKTLLILDWDHTEVQWFDNLENIWESEVKNIPEDQIINASIQIGEALEQQLDLPCFYMEPKQSEFFKQHYMSNWQNLGTTVKEIDVIRKAEGW